MKRTGKGTKLFSLLLAACMLACSMPMEGFAEQIPVDGSQTEQAVPVEGGTSQEAEIPSADELLNDVTGQNDMETIVYHEVTFILPAGISEEEAASIDMEDSLLVEHGTLIGDIPEPNMDRYLFMDWYLDKNLEMIADPNTAVTQDITLYPKFAMKEGMDDDFSQNFIAEENVAVDHEIYLVSYGLTAEEASELIVLRNQSLGEEGLPFTLETFEAPAEGIQPEDLDLNISEELLEQVMTAGERKQDGLITTAELMDELAELGLDDSETAVVLAAYAPEEVAAYNDEHNINIEETPAEEAAQPDAAEETPQDSETEITEPEEIEEEAEIPEIELEDPDTVYTLPEEELPQGVPLTEAEEAVRAELEDAFAKLAEEGIAREDASQEDLIRVLGLGEEATLEGWFLEEKGLNYEETLRLQDELGLWKTEEPVVTAYFRLIPEGGQWHEGFTYQVEILDTTSLRFLYETEETPEEEPSEEEAANEAADEPADEAAEAPADETADEPADEAAEALADETADEPADEAAEAPADETADEPADEAAEAPAEEPAEEPADETAEVPAPEDTETEETAEEAAAEEAALTEVISDEKIIYHNFTVYQEECYNMRINDDVLFLPADKVSGVDLGEGMLQLELDEDGNPSAEMAEENGILTYTEAELEAGDVIAVYDGILNADYTVDGQVAYVRISEKLADGQYAYETPDFMDVVFTPDNIPLPDDGSYEDGQIVVEAEWLDFSDPEYAELGLDADTTVDAGDFLSFYDVDGVEEEGEAEMTGYGLVTAVEETDGKITIFYEPATLEDMLNSVEMNLPDQNMEIPLTEEEIASISEEAIRQMEESHYAETAGAYMTSLIMGEEPDIEDEETARALKEAVFETEDGEPLTLEEVQQMTAGSKVEITANEPSFSLTKNLAHFNGKGSGIRATLTTGFTIKINLNQVGTAQNQLIITGTVTGEQEILLGVSADAGLKWTQHRKYLFKIFGKKVYFYWWTLDDLYVNLTLKAGTYTGLSFTAKVTTSSEPINKDTPWGELIEDTTSGLDLGKNEDMIKNGLTKLTNLADKIGGINEDTSETSGTATGTLPEKYSEFLKNEAEYIYLIKQNLFKASVRPDPLQLIELSLWGDLVVSVKVNCMMGFGLSFAKAKQYDFSILASSKSCSSKETDIESDTFMLNYYVFGMIGIRAGILLDARIGFLSTSFASVGIQGEIGVYAELYGFLFISYSYAKGKGSETSIQGSLLFEIGVYLIISFYAQVGGGKLDAKVTLYEKTWPLLQLGTENFPTDFTIKANDKKLSIVIRNGTTAKVSDDLFKINTMSLKTGVVSSSSKDSKNRGSAAYSWNVDGKTYTQYNEQNFNVECHDLTGENGSKTNTHYFQYLPESNTIVVQPTGTTSSELWGEVVFTYRNTTFGLNTSKIRRTVKVHWIGEKVTSPVSYYVEQEDGTYKLAESGTLTGAKGINRVLTMDNSYVNKFQGYTLNKAVLTLNGKTSELNTTKGAQHSFQVGGNGTKLELYYTISKYRIHWKLNPLREEDNQVSAVSTAVAGQTLEEAVPEGIKTEVLKYPGYRVEWMRVVERPLTKYEQREKTNELMQTGYSYWAASDRVRHMTVTEYYPISKIPAEDITLYGSLVPADYTVTWMNGDSVFTTSTVQYGSAISVPTAKPARAGYTFTGWQINGKDVTSDTKMPASNVTAAAQFKKNNYTIIWKIDGKEVATTQAPMDSLLIQAAPSVTQTGYEVAWTKMQPKALAFSSSSLRNSVFGFMNKVAEISLVDFRETSTVPSYDVIVYGEWVPHMNTVYWVVDQTAIQIEEVAFGSVLQAPERPEIEGVTYTPWRVGLGSIIEMPGSDETELLTADYTMPDEKVYIGSKTIQKPRVTWLIDDFEVASDFPEPGSSLTPPEVEAIEGYTLSDWMVGEEILTADFTMPETDVEITAQWIPDKYTVTWKIGDDEIASEIVEYGSYPQIPEVEENPGYTLSDWTINGEAIPEEFVLNSDITFTAQWIPNEYTVTWTIDNVQIASDTVAFGSTLTVPEVEAKTGYTLSDWMIGEEKLTDEAKMPASALTITAQWIPNQYKVTWIADGKTVKEESIDYGSKLTPPAAEVKTGYGMPDWMIGDQVLTGDAVMPDHNLTITAAYKPLKYLVVWMIDGKEYKREDVTFDTVLTPPEVEPKEGYTLSAWTIGGEEVTSETKMPAQVTIATASWVKDEPEPEPDPGPSPTPTPDPEPLPPAVTTYTVTWIVNNVVEKTDSLEPGSALTPPELTKEHYTLSDWMINGQPLTADYVMPENTITVIASWKANTHTVTWVSDQDGSKLDSAEVSYGSRIPSGPSMTARTGAVFEGWSLNGKLLTGTETMPDSDITLTAVYSAATYTAFWFVDGRMVKRDSVAYGNTLTPPDVTPKEGYTIGGWTVADESGTVSDLTADYKMPDGHIYLYAVSEKESYTATWMLDGVAVKSQVLNYGDYLYPYNPTVADVTGYEFSGWTVDGAELTGSYTMPARSITVTGSRVHNVHIWDDGVVTKKATCVERGTLTKTCTICGEKAAYVIPVDPDNHTHRSVQNKMEPTCSKDGYTGDTYCADCQTLLEKGEIILSTVEHKWDEGKVIKEATCSEEGIKLYTCTTCEEGKEETKEEAIPMNPKNHPENSRVTIGAKKVSCFSDGYTGDIYCIDCGVLIEKGEVIKASGKHTWSSGQETTPATEVSTGIYTYSCSVCGQKKRVIIPVTPKLGVKPDYRVLDEEGSIVALTIAAEDIVEAAKLKGAKTLKDVDPAWFFQAYMGANETDKDRVDVQAVLTWEDSSTAIADLKDGGTLKVHVEPSEPERVEKIDAEITLVHSEHVWSETTVTTAATCSLPGKGTRTCLICGETEEVVLAVDPTNHQGDTFISGKKAATETEDGYTGDTICESCGGLISEGTVIQAGP